MSTVPEVIVARHGGMKVLGVAVVTDRCVPDQLGPASVPEIIKAAMNAQPRLTRLTKAIIQHLK
jgi:purine-nucleoside phosphorylase